MYINGQSLVHKISAYLLELLNIPEIFKSVDRSKIICQTCKFKDKKFFFQTKQLYPVFYIFISDVGEVRNVHDKWLKEKIYFPTKKNKSFCSQIFYL